MTLTHTEKSFMARRKLSNQKEIARLLQGMADDAARTGYLVLDDDALFTLDMVDYLHTQNTDIAQVL